jgi:hypothetical protein
LPLSVRISYCMDAASVTWRNCFCYDEIASLNYGLTTAFRAVPWITRLVTGLYLRRLGFASGSFHVGVVMEEVALEQVICQYLSTVALRTRITSGVNKMPIGGRISDSQSHSTDTNKNNLQVPTRRNPWSSSPPWEPHISPTSCQFHLLDYGNVFIKSWRAKSYLFISFKESY